MLVLPRLLVPRASGRSFPTFLRERIFQPLKMTGTVAYVRGKSTVSDRAFGYTKDGGRWRFTDQSPTSATLGDGGVYSSLTNLSLWDEALHRHILFTEEEMRPALAPVRAPGKGPTGPDGRPADYGFGWFLNPWEGHLRMWHYGETIGFRTAIHRFTADGLTVIVLANRADLDASEMAVKIAGFYLRAKVLDDRRRDAVSPAVEVPDEAEDGLGRQALEFDPDLVGVPVRPGPDPFDLSVEVDELVGPGQVEPDADGRPDGIALRRDDPRAARGQVIGVGGDPRALVSICGGPEEDVVLFYEAVSPASFKHVRLLGRPHLGSILALGPDGGNPPLG